MEKIMQDGEFAIVKMTRAELSTIVAACFASYTRRLIKGFEGDDDKWASEADYNLAGEAEALWSEMWDKYTEGK